MEKSQRATILSISAQLKSLLLVFLAPLAGFLGDTYGLEVVMFILASIMLVSYPFTKGTCET